MKVEVNNDRIMTRDQYTIELLGNQADHYRSLAIEQEDETARLQRKVKKMRKERNLLRSQLSEALNKLREYREAEVTEQDAKLIEKRDIDYPGIDRAAREALEANLTQMASAGAIRGDEMRMVMESIKVPHHGPELSAAEDAMRDDGRYEFAAAFGAAVEDMSARLDKEFPARLDDTESQKDPTTGLVLNPDGSLRVVVQRGSGMLRVNLQSIDTRQVIGSATGNGVEETLGRIITPCERIRVREVLWDYHTLGNEFTEPDTTDAIKVDVQPETGSFDAAKFDILTGKPKQPLRLIMEKAPFGGIYYKLQDRKTLRLIQNGIAADVAAVLSLIPEADRERIYETRRYGMGVGE